MSLPKPYYDEDGITIFHADCRDILPYLEPVDLVLTDPPYGTGGWRRENGGQGKNPCGILMREAWDSGEVDWLLSVPTLTFWPAARTGVLLNAANNVGLVKHRALYMHKLDPKPQVAGRTAWSVEPIWCLSPDGFVLYGGTDWCSASTPRHGRDADATGHPYEKPIEVLLWLIEKTSAKLILDPFMGSGTTLRAAKDLGRKAIGIEIEEKYCEIAVKRLAQQVLPI